MTALAVPPLVPMPVQKFFVHPRLHFVFFCCRVALLVTRIVPAIRVHRRNKRHRLPIRRPQLVVRARRNRSQPRRLAALERDPINLRRPEAPGNKRQLLAVRRPARTRVSPSSRQLPCFAARRRHHPYVAHRVIRLQVRSRDAIRDPFAVRRNLRLAQTMQRNQILESDRALLGRLPRRRHYGHQHRDRQSNHPSAPPHSSSPASLYVTSITKTCDHHTFVFLFQGSTLSVSAISAFAFRARNEVPWKTH